MLQAPPVASLHADLRRLKCSKPKCNKERRVTKQQAHGMIQQPTCMTSLDSLLLPRTAVRVLLRFAAFSEAAWHSWGTAWKPLEASWEMPSGVMFGSIIKLDSSPQQPCTAMAFKSGSIQPWTVQQLSTLSASLRQLYMNRMGLSSQYSCLMHTDSHF